MDFKFKTTFSAQGSIITNKAVQKEAIASLSSNASLEGLKGLLPSKETIDKNPDLLFFTANLAVANVVNLNGDGVTTQELIHLSKTAPFKQINIEHDRGNGFFGCIVSAGFSEYGTNKVITEDEAAATTGPFNLSVVGALWKVAGDVWEIVEDSSLASSEHHNAVSLSWEIGFSECAIADNKDLSIANIKYGEDAEAYSQYLRSEGGTGFTKSGKPCYRCPVGAVTLGMGMVLEPAADVKGLITASSFEEESAAELIPVVIEVKTPEPEVEDPEMDDAEDEETKTVKIELEIEISASEKNIENNENKISIPDIPLVTKNRIMKFTDLTAVYAHLRANESEALASKALCDFIQSEVSKANDLYVTELASKTEAEAKLQEAIVEASESKAKIDELTSRLEQVEAQALAQASQDLFDARFTSLAETYDLDNPKLRALVAKQIRDLDDEAFEAWKQEDGLVILAGKEKHKEAVDVEAATESLKEAKASVEDLPNAQDLADPTPFNILDLSDLIDIKA